MLNSHTRQHIIIVLATVSDRWGGKRERKREKERERSFQNNMYVQERNTHLFTVQYKPAQLGSAQLIAHIHHAFLQHLPPPHLPRVLSEPAPQVLHAKHSVQHCSRVVDCPGTRQVALISPLELLLQPGRIQEGDHFFFLCVLFLEVVH
jgi:hypothetical protein